MSKYYYSYITVITVNNCQAIIKTILAKLNEFEINKISSCFGIF